jgi:hypothetical protein
LFFLCLFAIRLAVTDKTIPIEAGKNETKKNLNKSFAPLPVAIIGVNAPRIPAKKGKMNHAIYFFNPDIIPHISADKGCKNQKNSIL